MNIYKYKTEKQGSNPSRVTVKLTAECPADNAYLLRVIGTINDREMLRSTLVKRISDTQAKMHEAIAESIVMSDQMDIMVDEYNQATTELTEIKKSWVYKVLKKLQFFFENCFKKPKGAE